MRGKGKKFTGALAKQKNSGLGDALRNINKKSKDTKKDYSGRHQNDIESALGNAQSVIDESDFQNIVAKAHVESIMYAKDNKNIKVIDQKEDNINNLPNQIQARYMAENQKLLRIPRRPKWNKQMTKQQIDEQELSEFYIWRQHLSMVEENRTVVMSPYERNLEYWKQLWRVVEFSDLVFQIVDARNPLMFYCSDLHTYIKEIAKIQKRTKHMIVVLNKADLVSLNVRQRWSNYFSGFGVQHVFYSALREEAIIKYLYNIYVKQQIQNQTITQFNQQNIAIEELLRQGEIDVQTNQEQHSEEDEQQDSKEEQAADTEQQSTQNTKNQSFITQTSQFEKQMQHKQFKREKRQEAKLQKYQDAEKAQTILNQQIAIPEVLLKQDDKGLPEFQTTIENDRVIFSSPTKIVTRQQLLHIIKQYQSLANTNIPIEQQQTQLQQQQFTVGTVGYPNIGKSSVINTLAIESGVRTAVGETPGKTKHFQTVEMQTFRLCDCPGLVFPSFSHNRADFVLNGILPVDKERDYISYVKLLCKRIPARVLNTKYQLNIQKLDKFETGVGMAHGTKENDKTEFYCNYQQLLNEFNDKHGINHGQVGKKLVKDLFKGKLLYLALPPQNNQQKVKISKISDKEFFDQKKRDMEEKLEYIKAEQEAAERLNENNDGWAAGEDEEEFEEEDDVDENIQPQ